MTHGIRFGFGDGEYAPLPQAKLANERRRPPLERSASWRGHVDRRTATREEEEATPRHRRDARRLNITDPTRPQHPIGQALAMPGFNCAWPPARGLRSGRNRSTVPSRSSRGSASGFPDPAPRVLDSQSGDRQQSEQRAVGRSAQRCRQISVAASSAAISSLV
jgi:hypothetical protein